MSLVGFDRCSTCDITFWVTSQSPFSGWAIDVDLIEKKIQDWCIIDVLHMDYNIINIYIYYVDSCFIMEACIFFPDTIPSESMKKSINVQNIVYIHLLI